MHLMTDTFTTKMLNDITTAAPNGGAFVKVYRDRLLLNAGAVSLLCIDDADFVAIKTTDEGPTGKRIWIGKSGVGYALHRVGRRFRLNSTLLCAKMSELLQGYGTYRIEPDNSVRDYSGNIYYSIFFRRYD